MPLNCIDEGGGVVAPDLLTFPGGEPHVRLDPERIAGHRWTIDARLHGAADVVALLAVTDALRRAGAVAVSLFCPYFPGARQDRGEPGGALTAKVYADLINAQGYAMVGIVDPHSDVTPAMLQRCRVFSSAEILKRAWEGPDATALVCPDAGAEKRTHAIARALGDLPVIYGRKRRDPKTGELSGFRLDPLPGSGRYLLVDDICDGGGTFLGLAAAFEEDPHARASRLGLYVTHGIFSQGVRRLLDRYAFVRTTDSWPTPDGVRAFALWPLVAEFFAEGA